MTAAENVLWIGGRSGTGKSTVARLLARRHGLRWYSSDTYTWEHRDRAVAAGDSGAIAWEGMTRQQRSEMSASDEIRLSIDRSQMALDDVAALPDRPAVVAEGTLVVPSMVPRPSMAIWLTAPPMVRAARTDKRGWGAGGSEVDQIRERELNEELDATSATVIDTGDHVDPRRTLEEVEETAAPWLSVRPVSRGRRERQALIRAGNAAIVAQYRGGLARAANNDESTIVRAYDCECAEPLCTSLVERVLADLPRPFTATSAPILARGHQQHRV